MKSNRLTSLILCLNICIIVSSWSSESSLFEFKKTEEKVIEYLKGSWCSKEKAELIMELIITKQPKSCVEIGTFTGSSSLPLLTALAHLKQGHAYLIDAWSTQEAIKGIDKVDPNAIWWSTLDMHAIKNQLLNMLCEWKLSSYCTVIHAPSSVAASEINSIDFLHLDGNFSAEGALLDTQLYLPKVKAGGYILLSNILVTINHKHTKMKALWLMFDQCEIIKEIENGNAVLFRKI